MLFALLSPLFLIAGIVLLRHAARVLSSGRARRRGGATLTRDASPAAFWWEVLSSGGLGIALLAAAAHGAWRGWLALAG